MGGMEMVGPAGAALTVSATLELVALPAAFVTMARKVAPLSALATGGVA